MRRRKTRKSGNALLKLGWLLAIWIFVSFVGVMLGDYAPGSIRTWVDSLMFSLLCSLAMGPAYLVMGMFDRVEKEPIEEESEEENEQEEPEPFVRSEGMKIFPESHESRGKVWEMDDREEPVKVNEV